MSGTETVDLHRLSVQAQNIPKLHELAESFDGEQPIPGYELTLLRDIKLTYPDDATDQEIEEYRRLWRADNDAGLQMRSAGFICRKTDEKLRFDSTPPAEFFLDNLTKIERSMSEVMFAGFRSSLLIRDKLATGQTDIEMPVAGRAVSAIDLRPLTKIHAPTDHSNGTAEGHVEDNADVELSERDDHQELVEEGVIDENTQPWCNPCHGKSYDRERFGLIVGSHIAGLAGAEERYQREGNGKKTVFEQLILDAISGNHFYSPDVVVSLGVIDVQRILHRWFMRDNKANKILPLST